MSPPSAPSDQTRNSSTFTHSSESDLVDLATPVLLLIMQIRAGITDPSPDLRTRFDALFQHLDHQGEDCHVPEKRLSAIKYALTAFIDETVLMRDFPVRDEWERNPLQLQYFGVHLAGNTFYERLEELIHTIEENADVVEVYYLCLLLGYKGRYHILEYFAEQLRTTIEKTADALRRANRLRPGALSPHWKVTDQPQFPSVAGFPRWMRISGAIVFGIVVFTYLILKIVLINDVNAAKEQLIR